MTVIQVASEYFSDAPRSGRPKAADEEQVKQVLARVQSTRYGCEMTARDIGIEVGLSEMTA